MVSVYTTYLVLPERQEDFFFLKPDQGLERISIVEKNRQVHSLLDPNTLHCGVIRTQWPFWSNEHVCILLRWLFCLCTSGRGTDQRSKLWVQMWILHETALNFIPASMHPEVGIRE